MDLEIAEFELYVNFERQSQTPQRVFKSVADLIVAFGKLDELLVQIVLPDLHTELLLEDIQAGSIKSRLTIVLRGIPDEAIKSFDWKKLVGHFLLKAKYTLLKYLEGRASLTSPEELQNLQTALESLSPTSELNPLMVTGQLSLAKLVDLTSSIVRAAAQLQSTDYVEYRSRAGNARINPNFNTANLEALLVTDQQTAENEYLVKIKRPDFLGESMWEISLKDRILSAKMADNNWLEEFHAGRVDVRPNDYLRIKLRTETTFRGSFGNPINHYTVLKVLKVVRQ